MVGNKNDKRLSVDPGAHPPRDRQDDLKAFLEEQRRALDYRNRKAQEQNRQKRDMYERAKKDAAYRQADIDYQRSRGRRVSAQVPIPIPPRYQDVSVPKYTRKADGTVGLELDASGNPVMVSDLFGEGVEQKPEPRNWGEVLDTRHNIKNHDGSDVLLDLDPLSRNKGRVADGADKISFSDVGGKRFQGRWEQEGAKQQWLQEQLEAKGFGAGNMTGPVYDYHVKKLGAEWDQNVKKWESRKRDAVYRGYQSTLEMKPASAGAAPAKGVLDAMADKAAAQAERSWRRDNGVPSVGDATMRAQAAYDTTRSDVLRSIRGGDGSSLVSQERARLGLGQERGNFDYETVVSDKDADYLKRAKEVDDLVEAHAHRVADSAAHTIYGAQREGAQLARQAGQQARQEVYRTAGTRTGRVAGNRIVFDGSREREDEKRLWNSKVLV